MACVSACFSTPGVFAAKPTTTARRSNRAARVVTRADASSTCVVTPQTVASRTGSASVKGTVRKQNEDRFAGYVNTNAPNGSPYAIYSVFDGHGGFAVSEWLKDNLSTLICDEWPNCDFSLEAISAACVKADFTLIQPPAGFFGAFGERGVGGAKCGSTAVVAVLFKEGDSTKLATANVGDARTLLVRDGKAVQLSVDHIPDDPAERRRIDAGNPNLRQSLVTFKEGTWRVGGVLALSRAFGDAFLKESGKFEGFGERNADYGSGFGLNAEPDCYIEQLSDKDSWIMLSSDGLFANDLRGGGGGFENQEIADFLLSAPPGATPESLAKELCSMAVSKGSTDDITVTLMRL
eukprot:CAMPEP_0117641924 /NCGR_PEP_ID=MMETSP0802-20121206/9603_1 /TAXON_ID=38833 /ORGANISM="Micromonas sp., Strain CCMP2099" /LENGTH=349 /DNA_ID=CAMNT_0005446923 /DNA_START=38 /DNA_END=1087 /DNA_ORIENTATION=-